MQPSGTPGFWPPGALRRLADASSISVASAPAGRLKIRASRPRGSSRTGSMTVTRFAPSPTGRLHLGHAYAALFAARAAQGGRFLLRIEDIDATRCRPEFEQAIIDDLAWIGLDWEKPVRRQSEHMADYAAALDRL